MQRMNQISANTEKKYLCIYDLGKRPRSDCKPDQQSDLGSSCGTVGKVFAERLVDKYS